MMIYVLLFNVGEKIEGIHSLSLRGATFIIMFETHEDADRYANLLEAQDFPRPTVEGFAIENIEKVCDEFGYIGKFVPVKFIPPSGDEGYFILPPEASLDIKHWKIRDPDIINPDYSDEERREIDVFRDNLEDFF